MPAPTRLRVEHLDDAVLGTHELRPRLSWWLPDGTARQTAYRVRTGTWDSGRVESGDTVLVPYTGPDPAPGERVTWQVKVWTDQGESDWSAPAHWEVLGIGADTPARWIEPAEGEVPEAGRRPAHLLRHAFTLDTVPVRARVHATAHGVYELFVNGSRVGDHELAPGFTAYRSRLHVQSYDVTGLLRPGANVVGAVLSDGWFRGRTGFHRIPDGYGGRTALWGVLRAEAADGSVVEVGTGQGWFSQGSEIVSADLMDGQSTDFGRVVPGWSEPGGEGAGWEAARVVGGGLYGDAGRLTSSPAPPVRQVEELAAVSVGVPRAGVHVVDFGQNVNGWVRLADLGPSGTALTLTHGECLGPDGDVTTDHLDADDPVAGVLPVGQRDRVVSAGRPGEVFEPRHTVHGFRYVRIEGHPGPLAAESVRAVVVHTDLRRTGWFRCDDERLNRLHEMAVWSFRGNACDVPTDCPTRERAGFTGDWQIFAPTAGFLYDVAGFSVKWLRDLAADQWPDGRVPNWVPEPGLDRRSEDTYAYINGSAGWGDAAVLVPWETYQTYGDERVLAESYRSMVRWVEFAATAAREGRHAERVRLRPEAAPHEEYLWDAGFHWGEWTEPARDGDVPFYLQDQGIVATAYLYRSAQLLSRAASVLGEDADAARYAAYAGRVLDAWRTEFVRPDGGLARDSQATYVRALAFGLVPEEARAGVAERLVALVREAGTHLGTGFLATPYLLPVLADAGHLDVAYELLLQDTVPSWLAMVAAGATTVWEDWDAVRSDGSLHGSMNHYSKGAVVSFLHRHVAGLHPREDAPGYRRFDVRPRPGGGLTRARAEFDSVRGRIAVSWRIEDGRFTLDVTVPPTASAAVVLPDGAGFEAGPGVHRYVCGMR
ncbi:family 78 glycoside hydrolase catalytic domain [Streptomyces sp. NPDC004539]|uniref:family 78 glycoside hydrolase catalytic domain n=1 Tax=Streptomyces sp. NPDC004539 TaxID=3154280 RepID=UPI0033BDCCA0